MSRGSKHHHHQQTIVNEEEDILIGLSYLEQTKLLVMQYWLQIGCVVLLLYWLFLRRADIAKSIASAYYRGKCWLCPCRKTVGQQVVDELYRQGYISKPAGAAVGGAAGGSGGTSDVDPNEQQQQPSSSSIPPPVEGGAAPAPLTSSRLSSRNSTLAARYGM